MVKKRSPITTHVLDVHRGKPVSGMAVTLEERRGGVWKTVAKGKTDADGRIEDLISPGVKLRRRCFRLTFDSRSVLGKRAFYPFISIAFNFVPFRHHHIPLLLSGHGYTTYRGS